MNKTTKLLLAVCAVGAFAFPAAVSASGTLDQSNTGSAVSNGFGLWFFGNGRFGQSITPGVTASVDHVDFNVQNISSPKPGYNLLLKFYTNNAGSPSATQVGGTSDPIAASSLSTNGTMTFTWASGAPSLTSGVLYWMVITTNTETNSTTDFVSIGTNGGSGTSFYGTHLAKGDAGIGVWTAIGDGTVNAYFSEYVVSAVVPSAFQFINTFIFGDW